MISSSSSSTSFSWGKKRKMRSVVVFVMVCSLLLIEGGECGSLKKKLAKLPKLNLGAIYKGGAWKSAHATFYDEIIGGACGYANIYGGGFGTDTTALSNVLFQKGYGCGQCFELKCVNSPHCYGKSIIVTATNLCPPNFNKPSNNGGWCNPPREHFDLSKLAFMKIAFWRAGIVPIMYHRVPCIKKGGLVFTMTGNKFWCLIYITNVGGPGDIASVSIKGDKTNWISMSKNWGAAFQVFKNLQGQRLSFSITSYTTKKTVILNDVVPATWSLGQTFKTSIQLL